jgi:hypothetical protein
LRVYRYRPFQLHRKVSAKHSPWSCQRIGNANLLEKFQKEQILEQSGIPIKMEVCQENRSLGRFKIGLLENVGRGKGIQNCSPRCDTKNHAHISDRRQYPRGNPEMGLWRASHYSTVVRGLENPGTETE